MRVSGRSFSTARVRLHADRRRRDVGGLRSNRARRLRFDDTKIVIASLVNAAATPALNARVTS
jgi:hypothetical protein